MLEILQGNSLAILHTLPEKKFRTCVTSPPYWGLRDYGHADQLGMEPTCQEYVDKLSAVFREVWRVLADDGTLWLILGDCYAGSGKGGNPGNSPHIKQKSNGGSLGVRDRIQLTPELNAKNLIGIPWRVAFALQSAGWYLRSDIIWHKPNPMPESVTDRPTRAHEYIFLLSKSATYYYDSDAIKEQGISVADGHNGAEARKSRQKEDAKCFPTGRRNGMRPEKQRGHSRRHNGFNDRWDSMTVEEQTSVMRNKRDVWTVPPANYPDAHFATFPPDLIRPCILAGSAPGDTVLDPFGGSGTTGMVAIEHGRRATLIELNPAYCALARQRCTTTVGMPFFV